MPASRRKDGLDDALRELLAGFEGRILPFDGVAARRYADWAVLARHSECAMSAADGYSAAIAAAHGYIAASRDTSPYEAAGGGVISRWRGR